MGAQQHMSAAAFLRGSRRWTIVCALAFVILLFHVAGRLYRADQSPDSSRWTGYFRNRWGSQTQANKAHEPQVHQGSGLSPAENDAIKKGSSSSPQYISDVHQDGKGVKPSLARPEPMFDPSTPPHRLKHADDFRQLFDAISDVRNLTLREAAAPCDWSNEEFNQFPWGARGAEYVVNPRPQWEIDLIRDRIHSFVKTGFLPYPKNADYQGRGIVIIGGHPKSLKRVHVLIRALREVGSKLPVELHYWGKEISDATKQALLQDFPTGFYLNDLADPNNVFHSNRTYNEAIHINFQLKTAALINSRFAEPLMLDSDNIPAQDPELLWESETYKEYGTVFWPDIQRTQPENPIFAITNTPCRKDEYELESGQLLVNKVKFFYHLQLADWFMGQIYFNPYLLGDKDTFRFAWATLNTEYGRPKRWVTSVGVVLDRQEPDEPEAFHEEHCGHSFAQHHPDTGDVAFVHGGTLKSFAAPLMKRLKSRGGLFRSYKRSSVDQDWSKIEYGVHLKYMNATYLYEQWPSPDESDEDELRAEDKDAQVLCTEMQKVNWRDASEILPTFERVFERAGGYWPIDDEYRPGSSGA